ncbi:MAG: c-type cytochrome [Methylovirgula sp.]
MFSRFPTLDRRLATLALLGAAFGLCAFGVDKGNAAGAAPTTASEPLTVPTTKLFPGGGSLPPEDPHAKQYEGNAQSIATGKRLFNWYNCSGCHFHGAGGMGPPFMNGGHWIYGGRLDQIFASIYQGRPNGMPSWGRKIPTEQIWSLAAYVKALSQPSQRKETGGPPLPATHAPPPQPQNSGKTQ